MSLIPETLERDDPRPRDAGDRVNLETDILARYVERLLVAGRLADVPSRQLTDRTRSRQS